MDLFMEEAEEKGRQPWKVIDVPKKDSGNGNQSPDLSASLALVLPDLFPRLVTGTAISTISTTALKMGQEQTG